jgi:hypothetical protein
VDEHHPASSVVDSAHLHPPTDATTLAWQAKLAIHRRSLGQAVQATLVTNFVQHFWPMRNVAEPLVDTMYVMNEMPRNQGDPMNDEPKESIRNTERRLIEDMQPMMNVQAARTTQQMTRFNEILRLQLAVVQRELESYIADGQMPHEWGSIDSMDDMRNSLYVANYLMEMLQDVIAGAMVNDQGEHADPLDHLKSNFHDIFPACTVDPKVEQILGVSWDDES